MRQSGILAAAGLYALDHHREEILQDHRRARRLAEGVAALSGLRVVAPETNVVLIDLEEGRTAELLCFLEIQRILLLKFGIGRLRAVTHRDVDDTGIDRAVGCFRDWSAAQARGYAQRDRIELAGGCVEGGDERDVDPGEI